MVDSAGAVTILTGQTKENSFVFLYICLGDQWSNFVHHYHEEGRRVAPI